MDTAEQDTRTAIDCGPYGSPDQPDIEEPLAAGRKTLSGIILGGILSAALWAGLILTGAALIR